MLMNVKFEDREIQELCEKANQLINELSTVTLQLRGAFELNTKTPLPGSSGGKGRQDEN